MTRFMRSAKEQRKLSGNNKSGVCMGALLPAAGSQQGFGGGAPNGAVIFFTFFQKI